MIQTSLAPLSNQTLLYQSLAESEGAFEAIQRSPRHRSGIAVRFPRMARWRHDKKAEDADTIETIRALL